MNQPTPDEMRRPYAPPSNFIAVCKRARSRNLPDRIDDDFLNLAGVNTTGSIGRRVTFALRFLGLIGDDGKPTDTLRAISAASDTEYRELLTAAIRDAYADDFKRVDPETDTQATIVDAFRRYQPRSQTDRMVMLFLGLCREAGIPVLDAPRKRAMQPPVREPSRPGKPAATAGSVAQGGRQSKPRGGGGGGVRYSAGVNHQFAPGMEYGYGVTEDDLALLSDDQFTMVWDALGTVARARALARRNQGTADSTDPAEYASDREEGDS